MRVFYGLSLFFVAVLFSCKGNRKGISSGDLGANWPFTVESGTLECVGRNYVLTFEANGKVYALNDAAEQTNQYEDILQIVKYDSVYPGNRVYMDLSPVEFEGLKLCMND